MQSSSPDRMIYPRLLKFVAFLAFLLRLNPVVHAETTSANMAPTAGGDLAWTSFRAALPGMLNPSQFESPGSFRMLSLALMKRQKWTFSDFMHLAHPIPKQETELRQAFDYIRQRESQRYGDLKQTLGNTHGAERGRIVAELFKHNTAFWPFLDGKEREERAKVFSQAHMTLSREEAESFHSFLESNAKAISPTVETTQVDLDPVDEQVNLMSHPDYWPAHERPIRYNAANYEEFSGWIPVDMSSLQPRRKKKRERGRPLPEFVDVDKPNLTMRLPAVILTKQDQVIKGEIVGPIVNGRLPFFSPLYKGAIVSVKTDNIKEVRLSPAVAYAFSASVIDFDATYDRLSWTRIETPSDENETLFKKRDAAFVLRGFSSGLHSVVGKIQKVVMNGSKVEAYVVHLWMDNEDMYISANEIVKMRVDPNSVAPDREVAIVALGDMSLQGPLDQEGFALEKSRAKRTPAVVRVALWFKEHQDMPPQGSADYQALHNLAQAARKANAAGKLDDLKAQWQAAGLDQGAIGRILKRAGIDR